MPKDRGLYIEETVAIVVALIGSSDVSMRRFQESVEKLGGFKAKSNRVAQMIRDNLCQVGVVWHC